MSMSDTKYQADNKSPQEIEADIAETRQRIGEDIDAISYKLSPERLREQAQTTLHDAQEVVMNKVQEVTQSVADSAQERASGLLDLITDNPLPAALIGVGVGLLAAGGATAASGSGSSAPRDSYNARSGSSRYVSGYSEDVSDMYDNDLIGAKSLPKPDGSRSYGGTQGYSSSGSSTNPARQAKRGLARLVDEQPLAVGAVSLLIGAAIGMSMPGSRLENEMMGERSDTLIGEAKSAVSGVAEVAKETVSQAQASAKEEWANRSPDTPNRGDVKETVKSHAANLTTEVKDATKKVVDDAKGAAKAEADKQGLTGNRSA